ncbi:MAG: ABC transporter permease [Thermoplasmata archaeon]|nr:ABC transporter permease [Thermoplasmata archaeon]TFG70694.1 MAG: ABC transporter permease [Methanomassiliicoccus sp.]
MRFRKALNDRLLSWKMSGGAKQLVVEIVERGSKNNMVVVGTTIIVIIIALALLAPVLPMADPTVFVPEEKLQPPSTDHWFGTDELGRDVFSRVIWGSRVSLTVATLAIFFSLIIGVMLGLTAGYFGRYVDYIIAGTIDLFWTFPAFLLALAFAAALGPSLMNVILAISISYWAGFARLMRGQALSVRERLFVESSRALGARHPRIMFTHVLPNCIAPLIVWASIGVADAITIESSLSFLGVGTQPPTPSWGYMLFRGMTYLSEAPWISTFPGLVLLLTILGFNLLGDGLRDVLDPRMKGMRR